MPDNTDVPSTRPTCPNCDGSVMAVTVVGPTDGFATPCGCRVRPDILETLRFE